MEFDPRRIIRLLYLTAAAVFVLCLAFDFSPKIHEANLLSRKIKRAKMAVKTLSEEEIIKQEQIFRQRLDQFEASNHILKVETERISQKINRRINPAVIVVELEELAGQSKIELSSIKPQNSEIKDGFDQQLVELIFQSDYLRLVDFLNRLENSDQYLTVSEMDVTKSDPAKKTLNVRLRLLSVYRSDETAGPEKGAS